MTKIYPASSWRNEVYGADVAAMRADGHEVYDFREANGAFRWSCTTLREYIDQLEADPQVAAAFERDRAALDWCEVLVLILPCGKSAHLEAMFASAAGKLVVVKLDPEAPSQPELMYRLLAVGTGGVRFVTSTAEMLAALRTHDSGRGEESGLDDRIRELSARVLELAHNDPAAATKILVELTGLDDDAAFAAIDQVMPEITEDRQ